MTNEITSLATETCEEVYADANAFFEKLKKYEGRKARYENYEAIVEEMKSRGYEPFEYSRPTEGTVWLFFVNKKLSHVYYYIW